MKFTFGDRVKVEALGFYKCAEGFIVKYRKTHEGTFYTITLQLKIYSCEIEFSEKDLELST